ncbi:MAG: ABC transporter permease [Bryobacteraceae bacterium]|jgi:putative ABC transport system permease protein
MWTTLRQLQLGVRMLRKNPGFTFVAVLSLALGIGANTAIFQILETVRLRSIPVKDPQQLALVQLADRTGWRGNQASAYPALSNPIWERFRDSQTAFAGLLAWWNNEFNLAPGGEVRLARGLFVNGDFFRVLGVQPMMGRVFTADDDRRDCGLPGAVVSYSFWQREMGGDASAVGRKLTLNYQPVEVIGVTPAGFFGVEIGRSYDVAVPICSQAALWTEGSWLDAGTVWWLTVIGRLKPGWTLEKTNAQLQVSSPGLFQATLPANYPSINVKDYLRFRLSAVPAGNGVSWLRTQYGDPLLLLLATAALVLLIACANLANLMLARATAREHEIAIRVAIGASRGRLIRELMAESVLLTAAGGAAGLLLAGVLSQVLVALLGPSGSGLFLDLEPNRRVLAFAMGLAALTCILFGLLPAFRATRIAPGGVMKASGRSLTAGRERFGLRQALVVSQVALSLVLLVGALLFSGSLRNLLAVDAGFQRSGLLIADLDFRRLTIPSARRAAFKHDLVERVRALPGVDAAAEVGILPLSGGGIGNSVWMDGSDGSRKLESNFDWIGGGYLKTIGMNLLAGRDFDDHDLPQSPKVAIVNQSFARRLGLGADPVGKRFRREATPSEPETIFEVIGLVKDTKYYSLREEFLPIAFLSMAQDRQPDSDAQVLIHSTSPLADLTARMRNLATVIHPAMTIDFRRFDTTIEEGLLRERLMATLSGFFGFLAALIASVGLYGVMSYLVARRTNEIGIRMALGASGRDVLALIMRQAATLLGIGLAAGTVMALAAAQAARSMLFGLKPYDAATLGAAGAVLAAVTVVASYVPARRAARLEPVTALREE